MLSIVLITIGWALAVLSVISGLLILTAAPVPAALQARAGGGALIVELLIVSLPLLVLGVVLAAAGELILVVLGIERTIGKIYRALAQGAVGFRQDET